LRFCVRAHAGADASKKRPIEERGEAPSKRANLGDADGAEKPKAIKVLLVCPCLARHARPTCVFPASTPAPAATPVRCERMPGRRWRQATA